MKKNMVIIVIGLFVFGIYWPVCQETQPVKPDQEPLQTMNNPSRQQGKTRFRGFTVTIGNTGRAARDCITPGDFAEMQGKWNANIVRFIMQETAVADFMADCDAGRTPAVVRWLDLAREHGILPVIDLHDIPTDQAKVDFFAADWNKTGLSPKQRENIRRDTFWKIDQNLQDMLKFWRLMARTCADRPEEIWFDLYNEPVAWNDLPSYPKKWPLWAQAIIDEIRKIDTRHDIVIEPGPGGLCWGFKDFPALKGTNLIYSLHQYEPHGYTHQGLSTVDKGTAAPALSWPGNYPQNGGFWDRERLKQLLAPVVAFQRKHNVRIFVGEFGVVKWAPDAQQYLKDNIDLFEEYGWDWTLHIYRSSIPAFEVEASEAYTLQDGKLQGKLLMPPAMTVRGEQIHSYLQRNHAQ